METVYDIQAIASFLPHRYPFLLIDRVISLAPGEEIAALKNVTVNEPYFQGHFPDAPIMPGVLIVEAMAQAGLWAAKYGVESAEPKLLAHVGKKLDLKKAVENIQITHNLGIKTHLTFMFGIPGENKETIRRTVALAKKLNPDSVQFSILTPMPGTRIYDELQSCGHLMNSGWEQYDGYFSAVIRTDELSAKDLEDAVRWAWQQWYRHRMLKKLSWQDIARIAKSLPAYLRNPGTAVQQLKRLLND